MTFFQFQWYYISVIFEGKNKSHRIWRILIKNWTSHEGWKLKTRQNDRSFFLEFTDKLSI